MILRLEFMIWEDTTDIPTTISSTSATSTVLTDWWVHSTTSPEALWRLFYELARHQHQLELHITPSYYNSSSPTTLRNGGRSSWSKPSNHQHQRDSHPSLYIMRLIPILQRARRYGILSQLVLAHHSMWDPPPQHHHLQHQHQQWSNRDRAYSLIFEILANQSLATLHVNLPSSVAGYPPPPPQQPQPQPHDCSTTTNQHHHNHLLRSLGYAIAMNPCLKQLFIYSYRDWEGHATATLLEPLAYKPNAVQELYLYCPMPGRIMGSSKIISTVSQILQAPTCTLRQLEITCMRHHIMEMTGGDNDHSTTTSSSTTSDFPLRQLVQEGILCNHTASLTSLGLLHCGLTTNQVDQDLLYPLLLYQHAIGRDRGTPSTGCSSSLAHIHLDGNRIDSLYFPLFMRSVNGGGGEGVLPSSMMSHPTRSMYNNGGALTTVHMDHNPWQHQPPHRLLLLQVPPPHCHGPPNRRRGPHLRDSPGYPSTNAATDSPGDDSPSFLLSTMLMSLLQRHPRLIHFGVDPSSSRNLFSQNLHHHHQQFHQLAFATALNRSGFRPKHDDLIRLPLGVWPWVLHRVAAVMQGGNRIAYPPRSSAQHSHHPDSQSSVYNRTKHRATNGRPPRRWKSPADHQPNEQKKQEQHRQMEYQLQSSLIFYLLLHYHPWMLRVP